MLVNARTDAPLVEADVQLPVADRGADAVTCGFALRNVVSLCSRGCRARGSRASAAVARAGVDLADRQRPAEDVEELALDALGLEPAASRRRGGGSLRMPMRDLAVIFHTPRTVDGCTAHRSCPE